MCVCCIYVSDGVCCLTGQGGPYSPEGAALGGYGLDGQAHLGLRTAGTVTWRASFNTLTVQSAQFHKMYV